MIAYEYKDDMRYSWNDCSLKEPTSSDSDLMKYTDDDVSPLVRLVVESDSDKD